MKKMIDKMVINKDATIKDAIKSIMANACGSVFLTDMNGCFFSVVSDGDIRKAMLEGRQIEEKVISIASQKPLFIWNDMSRDQILEFLRENKSHRHRSQYGGTLKIPVLDRSKKVVNVLFVSIRDGVEHMIEGDLTDTKKTKLLTGVKSVLVTGGAGYLGSILCRKLLQKKYRVRVLDNLMYGDESIKELYKDDNFELIRGDIRNLQVVVESIKDVDAVVHLAAIVGDPATSKFPQESIDVNYLATKAMVDACRYYQVNRFIFASTCSVYGKISDNEKGSGIKAETNPVSLYAKQKLESERAILSLADDNFSPTILRMGTLYGLSPRMRFDLVINLLTAEAVAKKQINIFGGKQWRPFLHVDDAAEAYIKCLEMPFEKMQNRIFNIGSDEQNYQIHAIGRLVKELIDETTVNTSGDEVDIRDYKVSFKETLEILDFNANRSVQDGISEIRDSMLEGNFADYKGSKYRNVTA